jgi:alpha-beta hydrolase superfamily lysophospholipase
LLHVCQTDGSNDRLVAEVPVATGYFGFGRSYAFTPDGLGIVAIARSGVVEFDLVQGGWKLLLEGSTFTELTLSPDGCSVAVIDDMAGLVVIDRLTGAVGRTPSLQRVARDGSVVSIDFLMHPTFDQTGAVLLGIAWSHPRLPWDGTSLISVDLRRGHPDVVAATILDESSGICLSQPVVSHDRLYVLADVTGWMLPCEVEPATDRLIPLAWQAEPAEAAETDQGPGQRSWAIASDVAYLAINREGFGELVRLDLGDGTVTRLRRGVFGWVTAAGGKVAAIRTGARVSPTLLCGDDRAADLVALRSAHPIGEPSAGAVEPEVVHYLSSSERARRHFGSEIELALDTDNVEEMFVHARLYRTPVEPRGVVLWCHGGPISQTRVTYSPRLTAVLNAGYHVLYPDFRGSSGWGRGYRDALKGAYGVADVVDALCGLAELDERGMTGSLPVVSVGGSSGGLTALGLLARAPHRVMGTIASYPVSDLWSLRTRTHRFEQHLFDGIVGDPASERSRYRERSPHRWSYRAGRVLIFQGSADPVVPASLTRRLVKRLSRTISVEYVEFKNAGHGWSDPGLLEEERVRMLRFLDALSAATLN